jgi:hypothetical protein
MKHIHILILTLAAATLAAIAAAEPVSVNVTNARQRYPWNGLVDIEYVVTGTGQYRVTATAKDNASGLTHPVTTVTGDGAAGATVISGTHRLVWNAATDAPGLKTDRLSVTIQVTDSAPVTLTGQYINLKSAVEE